MQAQVSALQVEIETKQETLAAGPTPMELAELAALSGGRLHAHWGARQQRRGGMMGILSRSANKSPAVRGRAGQGMLGVGVPPQVTACTSRVLRFQLVPSQLGYAKAGLRKGLSDMAQWREPSITMLVSTQPLPSPATVSDVAAGRYIPRGDDASGHRRVWRRR